jgi:hypothetical protein
VAGTYVRWGKKLELNEKEGEIEGGKGRYMKPEVCGEQRKRERKKKKPSPEEEKKIAKSGMSGLKGEPKNNQMGRKG